MLTIVSDEGLIAEYDASGIEIRAIGSMSDTALVNESSLAEQFIGQYLIGLKHELPRLCYWLREGKSANGEVDYLLSQGTQPVTFTLLSLPLYMVEECERLIDDALLR